MLHQHQFFMNYSIIPIHKFNIYQTCLFIHKFIYRNQDLPDTSIIFSSDVHSFRTRHSKNYNLYLATTHTSHHQFNISYRGRMLWNGWPPPLRSISSFSLFKKQLKNIFITFSYLLSSPLPHIFILCLFSMIIIHIHFSFSMNIMHVVYIVFFFF